MNIRIANTEDLVPLSGLYDEFYDYNSSCQPSFYAGAKESGQYPKSVIDGTNGGIFVSEIDGEIVGFIHVEEDKTLPFPSVIQRRFACIVDFYVIPEYRKRGLGKSLLEKVKEWSISRGLEYLELFVLEENEIGRDFYERENFTTASRTLRYILPAQPCASPEKDAPRTV